MFTGGVLEGTIPVKSKESKIGQREKLNHNEVATGASANPLEHPGAGKAYTTIPIPPASHWTEAACWERVQSWIRLE